MAEWWDSEERRWLRRHVVAAPFGILIATIILGYVSAPELWGTRESIGSWASLVDLGAVIYAAIAVLAERGVKVVFWALDERRKWREKWRAQAQAEGHAAGRAEGRSEALTAILEAGRDQGNPDLEELIARVAREKGISLNENSE